MSLACPVLGLTVCFAGGNSRHTLAPQCRFLSLPRPLSHCGGVAVGVPRVGERVYRGEPREDERVDVEGIGRPRATPGQHVLRVGPSLPHRLDRRVFLHDRRPPAAASRKAEPRMTYWINLEDLYTHRASKLHWARSRQCRSRPSSAAVTHPEEPAGCTPRPSRGPSRRRRSRGPGCTPRASTQGPARKNILGGDEGIQVVFL